MDNAEFDLEQFLNDLDDSESTDSDAAADDDIDGNTLFKGRAFTTQLTAEWSLNRMIGTDVILKIRKVDDRAHMEQVK